MLAPMPAREAPEARPRPGGLDLTLAALGIAAALALRDTAFHVVPTDGGGSWRGVSDPPAAAGIALALGAAALAAWRLSRAARAVSRPFAWLLAAVLPVVPVLTGRALPLLAVQGPVLRLMLGAALAVALVRLLAERGVRLGRAPAGALVAAALAFYAAWGERFPGAGPQGDEPHYLVMAQSLLSDGDLDLADEFAGREYAAFYGGDLAPHTSPNTPPGRLLSMHSPGLPALLLPAYAAGGYRGARLFLSALAALAAALLYRLVLETTGDEAVAAGTWVLAALAPPLPFFAVTLYPETLAALAIVAFLLAARATPGAAALAAVTVLALALPWVHTKYIPLAAAGLGFTLLRPVGWRARAAAAGAFAASLALLAAFFRAQYGSPSFTVALGPADVDPGRAPWGLAGALLDRQYGLFVVAPALAVGAFGFAALWRRRPGDALRAATLAAIVALPAAAYVGWWGGAAPPARYVLPLVVPLLLAAAAVAHRMRDALAALAGAGMALLGLAADTPRMLRNRPDGESLLLRALSPAVDLNGWLPSFVEGGPAAPLLALTLVAAAALAWHFGGRGLLAGVAAYALVAGGRLDRPLVDRSQATQQLLWDWDARTDWAPRAAPVASLAVPVELPRRPWILGPGEARNSRRVNLPPGAYRVRARVRALEEPALVRLDVFAGELPLATASLGHGDGGSPLFLPLGGRGLAVSATGVTGRAEVEAVEIVPEALVAPERRAALAWPETLRPDRYRVESHGVRVTPLDGGGEPQAGGFRVRGTVRFLVEAPAGSTVARELRLAGHQTAVADDVETATGTLLGRTALLPLAVAADDAVVTFAVKGR